jgi:hypothetical protein
MGLETTHSDGPLAAKTPANPKARARSLPIVIVIASRTRAFALR